MEGYAGMNTKTDNSPINVSDNNRDKYLWLWLLCIAVGSVLCMLVLSCFNNELFLLDDSRNQWMPVMDKAYEQFFSTGKMPAYDFFQSKGLEIADQGYYCLSNPIMLLSYIIYSFVFMRAWGSTITFYILIMYALGNITAFLLCRQLGLDKPKALMAVLMYCTCAAFFMFGYWYYIFNNYLIIPLMLYIIIKLRDKPVSYIACGVVLAFSLVLSNVQYTVYHYIIFCFIMLAMAIFCKRKYFINMVTNCIAGLILSAPQLIVLMQASGRSDIYAEPMKVWENSLEATDVLVGMFYPGGIFGQNTLGGLFSSELLGKNAVLLMYAGGFGISLAGIIFMFVRQFIKRMKSADGKSGSKDNDDMKNYFSQDVSAGFNIGITAALLFFFMMMTAGIVAQLMSVLPVVKSLRYMFKGYFVFLPLCLVPAAAFIKKIKPMKCAKVMYVVLSVSIAVGFVNNFFVVKDTYSEFNKYITDRYDNETAALRSELEKNKVDTSNYRICTFAEDKDHFRINDMMIRNVPTTAEVFSLNAYDFTTLTKSFEQSDHIMTYVVTALYSNAGEYYSIRKSIEDKESNRIMEEQLKNNSVKYIILLDENKNIEEFTECIGMMEGISIKRKFPFMNGCVMLELEGIPGICTTPLKVNHMDELSFPVTSDNSTYRLSFTYKDKLCAEYTSADGAVKKDMELSEDENGYVLIKTDGLSDGTVSITYKDNMITIVNIMSVVITVLFVGLIVLLLMNRRVKAGNGSEQEKSDDLKKR